MLNTFCSHLTLFAQLHGDVVRRYGLYKVV